MLGVAPELRWGHSMDAFRQWVVVFGGHRRRDCMNDVHLLDTEAMAWEHVEVSGALPPRRGNHAAVVVSEKLWVFGGDAPSEGMLPMEVWSLALRGASPAANSVAAAPAVASAGSGAASTTDSAPPSGSITLRWAEVATTGKAPLPCCDHVAVVVGSRILLLGGSSQLGYIPLDRLFAFDSNALSWIALQCSGSVPSARSGHVAAALRSSRDGWRLFLFGGGNSAAGFDDLHQLDSSMRWRRCSAAPYTPPSPPDL